LKQQTHARTEKMTKNSDKYNNEQDMEFEYHKNVGTQEVLIRENSETKGKQILPEGELNMWHIHFGHIPMSCLQKL
jgi:hypothetical protein